MLLLFKKEDSFKEKFIIVGIWLYAFILLGSACFEIYLFFAGSTTIQKALFFSLLLIIAILLLYRSKIARFVVLINMYIGLWISLGFTLLAIYTGASFFYVVIQFVGIMIVLSIIFLFSNKKAYKLYGIKSAKQDFYWLILGSIALAFSIAGIYAINNDISTFSEI